MSEPIYEALLAQRHRERAMGPDVPVGSAELSLVSELEASASFADGTNRGELVPLADFTRHRMAKALRAASAALKALPVDARLLTPGIARIAAERAADIRLGEDAVAEFSRYELIAAAKCYLQVAQHGADGWHHPDGRYAPPGGWPWGDSEWLPSDDREKNLVTAGAYIAAALDAPVGKNARTTT